MQGTAPLDQSPETTAGPLDIRLSVTPDEECCCPLKRCDAESVQQSLSVADDKTGRCRLVIDEGSGACYEEISTCQFCPCPTFEDYECVNQLLEVQDDSLLFSVTIPDRSVLAPLIEGLRETDASVSVNRILTAGEEGEMTPDITEKQREAFLIAVERGYYERPRGATLDDIAEELGITSSAVSQRLTAVKRRLARKYARRYDAELSE
ncbi:Transcriptional regulator, contains HTH domain [Halanaeroarchaeum sp. HSR-CO]|uniref:helix-turn-helix domain-containing protein n=1 Tax=Halanaeroarchaeum sp. HSR-CO TaxID=2866382 RepID=UPI00217D4140|nr:helix-turn-helix domain-containing protein [Halanaeroarchaeum sp. HSR-CO]UWG46801.1 Transcriptional regulator, contains HTH domain [Halanaeroarchaeum sp. HSR-CO]